MIDPNKLCLGCMTVLKHGEETCPHCGFDLQEYEKSMNSHWLPVQTILAGKYMVGKVLGEGGFGITYLAWDLNLEQMAAIKEYFPKGLATRDTVQRTQMSLTLMSGDMKKFFEKGRESFAEEARNLAKFKHTEHVVSVFDFFSENETSYLVMDYVKGISLREYLKRQEKPLSEKKTLELMMPVMKSLDQVHKAGIIHRDISPDNILLDDEGNVTLIDFGAARSSVGNETKSLTVLLKHGYAPPEQYQTKGKQGPWTDIYALCATMYRMTSGIIPEEAIDRMVDDSLIPLDELALANKDMKVSTAFSDVIRMGLEIKAEDRYKSVSELMYRLNALGSKERDGLVLPERKVHGQNKTAEDRAETQVGTQAGHPEDLQKKESGDTSLEKGQLVSSVTLLVMLVLILALVMVLGRVNQISKVEASGATGQTADEENRSSDSEDTENVISTYTGDVVTVVVLGDNGQDDWYGETLEEIRNEYEKKDYDVKEEYINLDEESFFKYRSIDEFNECVSEGKSFIYIMSEQSEYRLPVFIQELINAGAVELRLV
ncbi:MAG: serine/threonine protein kinase [Clostridia bacterium]|nr:serine/threonine protein kinase [Clostridia bacterium]